MKTSIYRMFLVLLWVATLVWLARLLWDGLPFYSTPLVERPHHPDYWILKPGGTRGHAYGILGTALMVVMQIYSVRKRFRPLRHWGSLRVWLDFHIYCGVVGPLFVVLHSSFKVQGLVALSFWSMVVVAASGVLGRYLYLQLPRRRSGDELSLAEVEQESGRVATRLRQQFGLGDEAIARLDRIARGGLGDRISLLVLLLRLPLEGLALRWRLRTFRRGLEVRLPRPELRQLGALARQRALLERRILLLAKLQELFHYWHVIHKPFAVVMYLFLFVHVGVAMWTGYAWGAG